MENIPIDREASITRPCNEKPWDSLHVVTTRVPHLPFRENVQWSGFWSTAVLLGGFQTSLYTVPYVFPFFSLFLTFSIGHFGSDRKRKKQMNLEALARECNFAIRFCIRQKVMNGKENLARSMFTTDSLLRSCTSTINSIFIQKEYNITISIQSRIYPMQSQTDITWIMTMAFFQILFYLSLNKTKINDKLCQTTPARCERFQKTFGSFQCRLTRLEKGRRKRDCGYSRDKKYRWKGKLLTG